MFRGLTRDTPRFPAKEQKAILLAAGVPEGAIYDDDPMGAIKSVRADNRLVVCGLRALGKSREEIEAKIDEVHAKAKGAAVMDAKTKRTTLGKHRKALVDEAVRDLANERRGPRKRTKKDRRMPWDQVAPLYFNNPTMSNAELVRAVSKGFTPMSYDTMRRHFGKPRGALVGRPSASRAATVL